MEFKPCVICGYLTDETAPFDSLEDKRPCHDDCYWAEIDKHQGEPFSQDMEPA